MALIEKLGSFYLGREYDLANHTVRDQQINYDSRDLTTHAVCVGMTGSGKTGLCIDLLEEAALDGVPAIIIDPKGDITNLLLAFPDLRPEDFRPWINEDDAQRKGMDPDQYAAKTAQTWRDGLAQWDQGPERIRMLKDAAEVVIYTPGSEAGLPISILSSFQCPKLDWDTEAETLRDRVQGTVSALLGLIGVEADPVRSREHILLATIVETAWRNGEDLDLGKLILAVQKPPFSQLGVFDLETFYPSKDRMALAMMLNNIVASPSFGAWLKGDPLDIGGLLHTGKGKPRHAIFYIAHLSDAERMFFVTILLEQMIGWMRAQPGTTSLRALFYMDEVFGYFPPVANPPSKRPMLTLLKQARAFGLGIMLTTQNPVDVDYKGLSNAGTWFIGKLQAERDKARLLEGLQGAMAEAGSATDAQELDKIISSLDSRVFLLHDINMGHPVVFTTRWAMSYLRGPLTRQQIKQLMAPYKAGQSTVASQLAAVGKAAASLAPAGAAPAKSVGQAGLNCQPPVLAPSIKQVYLPAARDARAAARQVAERAGGQIDAKSGRLVYEPALLGFASARFMDRKGGVDEGRDFSLLLPVSAEDRVISWDDAEAVDVVPRDVEDQPAADALFVSALPASVSDAKAFAKQEGELVDHLYRNQVYTLASNSTLKLVAQPGESERDFRVRCQQSAREARDQAVDKLRDKYEARLLRLQDKLENEQRDLAASKQQYQGRQAEEVLSGLGTLAGALGIFGGRRRSVNLSGAAGKRRMTSTAQARVADSAAEIKDLQAEIDDVKGQMEADAAEITKQWDAAVDDIKSVRITPRKTDIQVQMVALAWAPSWQITYEDAQGRSRIETVPAYGQTASKPSYK